MSLGSLSLPSFSVLDYISIFSWIHFCCMTEPLFFLNLPLHMVKF